MSSRALRKLQKGQELEKQLSLIRKPGTEDEESDESQPEAASAKPINAFDMLSSVQDEDASEEEDENMAEPELPGKENVSKESTPLQSSRPKKKKKKSKRAKGKASVQIGSRKMEADVDEIDRAVKELALKNAGARPSLDSSSMEAEGNWEAKATKLLAIDSKNLNPVNEMKSLFGNIALEGLESRSSPRNQRRREQSQQGGVDLATALTGRYSPASKGKNLGALAGRRNVFMQGKEEWPLATSGGLSMSYQPDTASFEKRYNIIHNSAYRETQREFQLCVQSMEPQNLISLLALNPYHISTLLQVSEIAKVQGDHSISGDLLERALFTFGRSVHSTFGVSLREGVARIGFERAANRELYLTIWRYVRNLEMRGTWRTAFEWAKLLFQFDTLSDPYGVTLMIDQLALRGRQYAAFIDMCAVDAYRNRWRHLPNIQISLALAYMHSKEPKLARQKLAFAMQKYPYILGELARVLDVGQIPKTLWGKLPSTSEETLYTQLYVTRAKDLWNTPECTSLLVEVAETLDHYSLLLEDEESVPKLEVSLEEARHVMLLEVPSLIALLPRKFTQMPTSSFDVLPPPEESGDFTPRAPGGRDAPAPGLMQSILTGTAGGAGSILGRVLNMFYSPAGPGTHNHGQQDALRELGEQLEMDPDEVQEMVGEYIAREHMDDGDGLQSPATVQPLMGILDEDNSYVGTPSPTETSETMPELEEISDQDRHWSSMVARVEDDADVDEARAHPSGGALLRRVDSEDDEPSDPLADSETMHSIFTTTNEQSISSPVIASHDAPPYSDPERIQRWLLTSGYDSLQQDGVVAEYVQRLNMLPKQKKEWTMRMVEQRGGKDLADTVREAMGD